jgi:isopenicillin-N N-acyltransferase-like protein
MIASGRGVSSTPEDEHIRVLDLSGDAHECGLAHGRALRDEIEQCLAAYSVVLDRSEAALRELALGVEAVVRAYEPSLVDEMNAIAEGAGVDPFWIHALNARSEIMSNTEDGCTAVFQPSAGLLGQTWDWIEELEHLFVVLRIERPDGHRILTVTEPGMLAKIGMNSAGLGVCLNFLYAPGPHEGTPIHPMLRAVLEATSADAAKQAIADCTPGQASNFLIGTSTGEGFDVEFAGKERTLRDIDAAAFVHTNHHLWYDIPPGNVSGSTEARLATAQSRLDARPIANVADLITLFGDQSHPEHPICARYHPRFGTQVGTLCTVVMELGEGTMHVRRGPNPDRSFQQIKIET